MTRVSAHDHSERGARVLSLTGPAPRLDGFTLVEVLIVVIILGILAALVVPQFSSAATSAKESTLRDDLRYLRTQIMVYRAQHKGVSPGHPGGDATVAPTYDAFVAQMTQYSSINGGTSPTPSSEFKYGPYLQRMPENPLTNSAAIRFLGEDEEFPVAPGGAEGWIYQPSTAAIRANVAGTDSTSTSYYSY